MLRHSALLPVPAVHAIRFVEGSGAAITPSLGLETMSDFGFSMQSAKLGRLKEDAISQLRGYGKFLPGWDGYRGKPFDSSLLTVLADFVSGVARLASLRSTEVEDIVPGPASDGSIDIQFVRPWKRLTITLYPHAQEAQTFREGNDGPYERTIPFESAALVKELSWFLS